MPLYNCHHKSRDFDTEFVPGYGGYGNHFRMPSSNAEIPVIGICPDFSRFECDDGLGRCLNIRKTYETGRERLPDESMPTQTERGVSGYSFAVTFQNVERDSAANCKRGRILMVLYVSQKV